MVVNDYKKQNWKKTKLLFQLEYMKQATQRASYKKIHKIMNEVPLILHRSINQARIAFLIR